MKLHTDDTARKIVLYLQHHKQKKRKKGRANMSLIYDESNLSWSNTIRIHKSTGKLATLKNLFFYNFSPLKEAFENKRQLWFDVCQG